MDVTWIPGDADALVLAIAALVAIAGGGGGWYAASRRGRGSSEPSVREGADAGTGRSATATTSPTAPAAPGARLDRLSSRLGGGFGARLLALVGRGDGTDWDGLEEALLASDVGTAATDEILEALKSRLRASSDSDPREALREVLLEIVDVPHPPMNLGEPGEGEAAPMVVVGVNGVGKTTTIGKLARLLTAQGYSLTLGAADTFRAAAADQLETWGSRIGVETVRSDRDGADPASVAFQAMERGVAAGSDVVIVDTAGRLQNKAGLMDELGKIVRVIGKTAQVREVLLVLDATTGQNGLNQARVFAEVANVTGIVLTKMDGSAKGGIALAVQRELGVPIRFIGLGEGEDDLAPFEPGQFVDGLLG